MIELDDLGIVKVLTIFSLSPGSRFNRKFLKEKTNMPNIILDKTLIKLENFGFIKQEKNLWAIDFKKKEIKELLNEFKDNHIKFKQLPFKEYFVILKIIAELSQIKDIGEIYLFGSYAKLIFKEKSDIDIAIISDRVNKKKVNLKIFKLEKKFKKRIETHIFTKEFYKNKKDALVREILQHGILI